MSAARRLEARIEALGAPSGLLAGRVALSGVQELGEGVWACRAGVPYNAIARALSGVEGGQWMASGSGLTWLNGRECCWLLEWERVEEVTRAKGIAAGLGVAVRSWTLGGVARALLKWAEISQRNLACSTAALGGTSWAYHACEPGSYPHACLCDLAGAYHQVVERLPSPKLDWTRGGPCWEKLTGEEAARWGVVKAAARAHKGLRTRLLGCMIGGGSGVVTWCRGQRLLRPTPKGPLVTAGLLVARTVYELCALEARASAACYANTDCVVTERGTKRTEWERYGYAYRVEAEGTAELVALGCYRVGERQTKWFGAGGRFPVGCPADPVPSPLTLTAWH